MITATNRSIAALLTAHAVAQMAGFAWPWWLFDPLPSPPQNTALIGDAAMQGMSLLWLAAAMAFLIAAIALLCAVATWRRITATAALASLGLSVLCWPGSLLGVPINLTILLLLWRRRRQRVGHDVRLAHRGRYLTWRRKNPAGLATVAA